MATDTKITSLTALTGANTASGDLIPIVDVSDTTQASTGTTKRITRDELKVAVSGPRMSLVFYRSDPTHSQPLYPFGISGLSGIPVNTGYTYLRALSDADGTAGSLTGTAITYSQADSLTVTCTVSETDLILTVKISSTTIGQMTLETAAGATNVYAVIELY